MKITFDKDKTKETLSGFMKSTVEFSKKTAVTAKTGVANMVEKSKEDSYARRMKKYNPLFPEQYNSESFKLPNIIMIVDDAVRRGIDVCEGAIGWLNSDAGAEVLYLYDEYVESSGIQFIPKVTCDAVYYVDGFDRSRYIQADCIFGKAHDERLAELDHIAYCLGAQKYTIEIEAGDVESISESKNINFKESLGSGKEKTSASESIGTNSKQSNGQQRIGRITAEFQDNKNLQQPTLKWFQHDDNIKQLIEMRCSGNRTIKTKELQILGSSCATMSQKTACTLDAVINGGKYSASSSMAKEATQEHHSKLLFHIEF